MNRNIRQITLALLAGGVCALAADPAHALRCGNRLVQEGMYEWEVIELCGEPVSKRYLGHVLRPHILEFPGGEFGKRSTRRVYGGFHVELPVTELVFNFGPRKLIRVLRFEGGELTSIRTAGYGYREKDD